MARLMSGWRLRIQLGILSFSRMVQTYILQEIL